MTDRSRPIDAAAFLSEIDPGTDARLEGKELARAYWRTRHLRAELERKERYWTNICEALSTAYDDLERTTNELAAARTELAALNVDLEKRVDAQVNEIRAHADRIERLNQHLSAKVEERSHQLLAFAREIGARGVRLEPGTILNGRTRVGEPIGEGGAGIVYRASDDVLGDRLAVKVLRRQHDHEATMRFLGEAGAASRATHPAIVRPLHLDVSESGLPYIIMELVDGRSLRAQLATFGMLPPRAVARFGAVLVQALASAHDAGVVHRDVKPGNIMLTPHAPGLRVLDFGLSKATYSSSELTLAGRLMGTPAYMAPEQIVDPASAGPPADVYAAGSTLFEMCSGRVPFDAPTALGLSRQHLDTSAPDLRSIRPDLPDELADIIATMLAKAPERRPLAVEIVRLLDRFADQLGASDATTEAQRILVGYAEEATL